MNAEGCRAGLFRRVERGSQDAASGEEVDEIDGWPGDSSGGSTNPVNLGNFFASPFCRRSQGIRLKRSSRREAVRLLKLLSPVR